LPMTRGVRRPGVTRGNPRESGREHRSCSPPPQAGAGGPALGPLECARIIVATPRGGRAGLIPAFPGVDTREPERASLRRPRALTRVSRAARMRPGAGAVLGFPP
jgi:hypothetical protein